VAFSSSDALHMMSINGCLPQLVLSSELCAQMVLAILQYLAPAERSAMPNAEQEKGFVTILRHAGFHSGSGAAVFEPACVICICCSDEEQVARLYVRPVETHA